MVKTNDYFSWEVERVFEKDRIFNSVQCLITEHHISEDQAKERLKASILQDEWTYKNMLDEFHKSHPNIPIDVRRYVAAGPLFVGGTHYWSAVCQKYNPLKVSNVNQASEATIEEKDGRGNMGSNDEEVVNQCVLDRLSDRIPKLRALDETADLDSSALLAPVHYIQSLPSKNYRSQIIDAFNVWFRLPEDRLNTIKAVINDLHNASLILDDIQDESTLRRGSSTTHCIFGAAKCINSATYMVVQAASRIHRHRSASPQVMSVFLDGLTNLSLGQSWDLEWKFNTYCPSVAEYMSMIDGKTGAMFQMIVRIMHSMSLQTLPVSDFDRLTQLLGRWYQVRDDFQNLEDPGYTEQKGYCEDLDEGKLSYPVILSCNSDPTARTIILGIFRQKGNGTPLARNIKTQILNLIRNTGALEKTWQLLQQVEKEAEEAISALEAATREPNPSLRLIAKLLSDIAMP